MGVNIRITSGPVLEKPGDLAGLLTNLNTNDVLFIDEIHRLKSIIEEYLYPAMEDFNLDIIIGDGPAARSIQIALPKFTLIGATTRAGLLSAPLRARFGITNRLDYYNTKDLYKIVKRSAEILNVPITDDGGLEVATRSRGTPRIANRLLRRLRDFAQVEGNGIIDKQIALLGLERLDIDLNGLDMMDKRILQTIVEKFSGGPVGLKTLAVAVGEEDDTIEEIYEPYLIQEGLIERTTRGRKITLRGRKMLDINYPEVGKPKHLFE